MRTSPYPITSAHSALMSNYYRMQAPIYDLTRWMFLFGREQIIRDLDLKPGQLVVEVGCGTGKNLETVRNVVGEKGEVIGVDCSEAMVQRTRDRVQKARWRNVRIMDDEYGWKTITRGEADVVLFSYCLSMIPSWKDALNCAREELKSNGRIGIVDFSVTPSGPVSRGFTKWMAFNHVDVDRRYRPILDTYFQAQLYTSHRALGAAWNYFRYVGRRTAR